MAGKSNKGKNRKGSNNGPNSSETVVPSDAPAKDNSSALESIQADANGVPVAAESTGAKPEVESETDNSATQTKQGKICNLSTSFISSWI